MPLGLVLFSINLKLAICQPILQSLLGMFKGLYYKTSYSGKMRIKLARLSHSCLCLIIEQCILDNNAGNNCLKLPQMSNKHWCWKNEQHLNINDNFDHQMSLSKSKCWYSNNCLHFSKRTVPLRDTKKQWPML